MERHEICPFLERKRREHHCLKSSFAKDALTVQTGKRAVRSIFFLSGSILLLQAVHAFRQNAEHEQRRDATTLAELGTADGGGISFRVAGGSFCVSACGAFAHMATAVLAIGMADGVGGGLRFGHDLGHLPRLS